ncbi:MAG: hypothetical protein ACOCVF_03070 [bacterium]
MNKELNKIINDEYFNIKKKFNINNKNRIKSNSKDIEDIFHDCLLKVLEKAELDNFKHISKEKTLNYVNKTMFIKSKHLKEMKEKKEVEETDNSDVFDYINRNYSNTIIQQSIFYKIFMKE